MDRKWTRWQDWTNAVLGAWLFFSPWIFGFEHMSAIYNAWVFGVVALLVGVWALAQPSARAPEGLNIVLGVWLFLSPWVLGFEGLGPTEAAWNTWIVGALITVVSLMALPRTTQQVPSHA